MGMQLVGLINGQKGFIHLTADAGAGAPVGFIAPFYKKGNYSGWLYCDGSTFDETQYPLLYAYLGTNVLPDLREVGLKGAEKNTTYIFDSTETDPRTGQAGTQNHDVFSQGEFKDDQVQEHTHKIPNNNQGNGANGGPYTNGVTNLYNSIETFGVNGARTGTVTRGKSFAIFYYIKATSGLTEGQQDDVANIINGERSYSTEEVNTGKKWIDGKPIYRKVIDCGAMPNNTTKNVAHNISNLDNIINISGYARNGVERLPLPFASANYNIEVYINSGNIKIDTKTNYSSYTGYVILEYTKTT